MNIPPAPPPKEIIPPEEALIIAQNFCSKKEHPLIAVVGPTASGKTDFSLDLAEKVDGEIINCDSRQFYRGLNIGTAKILPEEMRGIPHHALDFLNPNEAFSVGAFVPMADEIIREIVSRKKNPILVGGSGLFVDAIRKGFVIPAVPPNAKFREALEKKTDTEIFDLLRKIDPASADKIGKKRRRNAIRALEVCHATGKKFSELKKAEKKYDDLLFAPWADPDLLCRRIAQRVARMFDAGFIKEVQELLSVGFSEQSPGMEAHGYREAMAFIRGEISEAELREKMIIATRQYAKRQRTWWRREEEVVWVGNPLS